MKRLLLIFILTVSFQLAVKADDIKDFEIEGISVGDSLLDYFSKDQILNERKYIKRGEKYFKDYSKFFKINNIETFDYIVLYFKSDDKKFIIKGIAGRTIFKDNIQECYTLQDNIVDEINLLLRNSRLDNLGKIKLTAYPNGESYKTDKSFYFDDGSLIHTACYDYSINDTQSRDRLSLMISSKEYLDWYLTLK